MVGSDSLWFLTILVPWIIPPSTEWGIPQPRKNVWVTLANALQQDHMCLSMAAASDPLSTCLAGIPYTEYSKPKRGPPPANPLQQWDAWAKILPNAEREPQELELLGSAPAPFCLHFYYKAEEEGEKYTIINPHHRQYTLPEWCNVMEFSLSASTNRPKKFPKVQFLICGDQAWAGIPSCICGGPCTLGRLMLFTPNMTQIINWSNRTQLAHEKRES